MHGQSRKVQTSTHTLCTVQVRDMSCQLFGFAASANATMSGLLPQGLCWDIDVDAQQAAALAHSVNSPSPNISCEHVILFSRTLIQVWTLDLALV